MVVIAREYSFSAAHRIEGHPKCGRLHGHNYKVIVEVRRRDRDSVDDKGMVIDFGDLDNVVKPIINRFDHRYLVSDSNRHNPHDPSQVVPDEGDWFHYLGLPASTAEYIAEALKSELQYYLVPIGVIITRVIVWETEKSYAQIV